MNREELIKYFNSASDIEVEENISAGPGDGMAFRYSAAIAEKDKRRHAKEKELRKPHITTWPNFVFTVIGSIAAVVAAYFGWLQVRSSDKQSPPVAVSDQSNSTPTPKTVRTDQ